MITVFDFLNSNTGVVTFAVGFIAIYLYIKQRIDRKTDAARLILQEIRYAEQQVRRYKEFGKYKLPDRLLPTNNWNKGIHLFVKDLKEADIDLINAFYAKATYIDIMIRKISDWKNQPKPYVSQTPLVQVQPSVTGQIQKPVANESISLFDPMQDTQSILLEVSMGVEFIYNTPSVEKLRRISEKKWYQLF
jgi:hypothetical protein